MSSAAFPFSVPINMYLGSTGPTVARAEFQQNLPPTSQTYSIVVAFQDTGTYDAGLYVFHGDRWQLAIPYDNLNDYIISGGDIALYVDLTAAATPEAGATVFRNGIESTATSLTPSSLVIWATIKTNATSGSVAGVSSFNGRSGAVTLTANDVTSVGALTSIPAASTTALGGVKIATGSGLSVDSNGSLSLLTPTGSDIGGVKAGTNVTIAADGTISVALPTVPTAANPSGSVGLTAVNGAATTYMRSDAAPAINQAITPTWTGAHIFTVGASVNTTAGTPLRAAPAVGASGNNLDIVGSAVSGVPTIVTSGADNNISLNISTKGSGGINLNSATTVTGILATSTDVNVGGNVNVKGNVSSTTNTSPAGTTNSGVALTAAPAVASVSFYDATKPANSRTGEWIFFQGAMQLRFKNDAGDQATSVIAATGGYNAVTGISSNSGTGTWAHTGKFSVSDITLVGTTADFNSTALQVNGSVSVINVGAGYRVAEGTNAKQGVATLGAGGTVTVANTSVTANSRIFLTGQNDNGGTAGWLRISARVPGTSFTITSSSATDTSIVAYEIFEPA